MRDSRRKREAEIADGWDLAQRERLVVDIEDAHRAWKMALEQFNCADSQDVIDDAIYLLIAAERRYEGLLRVARRQRISVDLHGQVTTMDIPFRPSAPVDQKREITGTTL